MMQCHSSHDEVISAAFSTPEQAFQAYKKAKEKTIKEIAVKYKSVIPQKLFEAMINYKVEIND